MASSGDKKSKRVVSEDDLISVARSDLVSFSRWPLGYSDQYTLWKCQVEWQEKAQEAYEAKLKDPLNGRHLCLLAPSEHGKTYGLDIPFILWALARNRNLRIGIVGSKDDLSANIGHGIDRIFKDKKTAEPLEKFGLYPGYPWNAYEKFLQRDDSKLIHPSLFFVGPDNELQGVRFDIIFLSDFCTFKNQRTPEARAKLLDWLDHTLFPRLEPWGFVMAEGHHVDPDDIYTEFEERNDEWKVLKYRAILEEPSQENGGKGKILAPEQWTYKQLSRIRAKRPSTFQLIYQNVPVQRAGIVQRGILEAALDRGRPLCNYSSPDIRAAYDKIVMGVDPAFTIKPWSSYSVALIWGITKAGNMDLLGGWRLRLLSPQLKSKIVQTIHAWAPDNVFIEANAAQIFLVKEIQQSLGKLADRVRPVYTLAQDPDSSIEQLMGECVSKVEAGLVTFPYNGQDAQSLVEQLFTEMINFPNCRTKDVAMAWNITENGLKKIDENVRRTIRVRGLSGARRRGRMLPGRLA